MLLQVASGLAWRPHRASARHMGDLLTKGRTSYITLAITTILRTIGLDVRHGGPTLGRPRGKACLGLMTGLKKRPANEEDRWR
jgi:hypothetical protein